MSLELLELKHISSATIKSGLFAQTSSYLPLSSFARLLASIDITPNPREPKKNPVVNGILTSLQTTPELYSVLSKGVVVVCESLAVSDTMLTICLDEFETSTPCGILDGGHNCYALAKYTLELAGISTKKHKSWNELKALFNTNVDQIVSMIDTFGSNVNVPVCFLYADNKYDPMFSTALWKTQFLSVSCARNTASAVSDSALAYQQGVLDLLKDALPDDLDVEWKTNDGGKIKAQNIAVLTLIPLKLVEPKAINLVSLYSSKKSAFDKFKAIVESSGVTDDDGSFTIHNETIASAFDIVPKLIEVFEFLEINFPALYNYHNNARFGGLGDVKKRCGKSASTSFRGIGLDLAVSDGFLLPILCALHTLMEIKDGRICWKVEPISWIETHAAFLFVEIYKGMSNARNKNDPQKVGKDAAYYELMSVHFTNLLLKS